jgi:hypothetical protein
MIAAASSATVEEGAAIASTKIRDRRRCITVFILKASHVRWEVKPGAPNPASPKLLEPRDHHPSS